MDATAPSPERIELSVLSKNAEGNLVHHTLGNEEVNHF
jgi:hypothetical protein